MTPQQGMSAETMAIVEDDAAIRAVLKVALKRAGYSLVCEALAKGVITGTKYQAAYKVEPKEK